MESITIDTLISALVERVKGEDMEVSITIRPTKKTKEQSINWKRIEELYPKDKFDWEFIEREMIKCRTWWDDNHKKSPSTMGVINWMQDKVPKKVQSQAFTTQLK